MKKKISQTREPFYPAGFGALHYFICQLICIKHIHRVPLPVCLSHFASLPLCTSHFSPPLLFLPPSLHPCWHAAVKGSSRRVQLWNQPSGWAHPGGFFLYVCGFLVKLQISTTEQAHPLPQIIPPLPSDDLQESFFFLFFFFLPSISSPAPQSPSTDGVPVIINNLGEDALRRWGQGGGGRKSERMGEEMRRVTESVHPSLQHLSCLLALQSLLCTCATSNAPGYQPKRGGIFHVVSIFVYFFSSQRGPLWGCSRPVMWRIWSWDAWGLRVGDGP